LLFNLSVALKNLERLFMKNLVVALAVLLSVSNAYAQDGESRASGRQNQTYNFGINAEPIWVLLGGIGARADVAVTRKTALSLQGIYIPEHQRESTDDKNTSTTNTDYKWSYSEVNFGPTFMLIGDLSTNGLYLNTSVGYIQTKITEYSSLKLQGELSAPQLRATVGYQWRIGGLRLAAGGGLRLIQSDDIVVKDAQGREMLREKSNALGGLAIDGHVGWVF
jgi:hypothetical protein